MKRLRELRKEINKTQQNMADYLKITQQAYATYENGKAQPPLDIASRLADYFKVSVDYLLERTDDPQIYVDPPELPDVYYRLGAEARKRGILPEDAEKIIELYQKYKEK